MNDTPIMRVWGLLIPSDGRHDAVIGMARLLALSPDPRIQLHLVGVRSIACLLQKAGLGTPTPFQQPLPPLLALSAAGTCLGKPVRGTSGIGAIAQ